MIRAHVDTGCTTTIADPRIVSTEVMCSVGSLRLSIEGHDVNTQCLVLSSMLEQFKLVIGMDIIQQLGGVTITKTGHAEFKQFSIKQTLGVVSVHTATVLHIDDVDFMPNLMVITGRYNGNGLGWNQSYIINCLLIKLMIM